MRDQDEFVVMMKETILLFAPFACLGSFDRSKSVMGFGDVGVAAVFYLEKGVCGWFRRYFPS